MVKKILLVLIMVMITASVWCIADTAENHESEHHGLKKKILEYFTDKGISKELTVFLISMLPIFELRGAIPVGVQLFEIPWYKVFAISVAGNMVPIFLILVFFGFVEKFFRKFSFTNKLLEKIFEKTRKKSELIKKYEELGLIMFVAIPLPVTGAWTGSLAAYLFGLKYWKSLLFIFIGVVCAGVVVTTLTLLGWTGAVIALIALTALLIIPLIKSMRK